MHYSMHTLIINCAQYNRTAAYQAQADRKDNRYNMLICYKALEFLNQVLLFKKPNL